MPNETILFSLALVESHTFLVSVRSYLPVRKTPQMLPAQLRLNGLIKLLRNSCKVVGRRQKQPHG
jgi:hypothetical protein